MMPARIPTINSNDDLADVVHVLNVSHETVARDFGFTRQNNPTNNAFIDAATLKKQLEKGIQLFAMSFDNQLIGCIAIEKASGKTDTWYIEKVSVLPEYRNQGFGEKLLEFAFTTIREAGGKCASIAVIDSNLKLKAWYCKRGFMETGTRDFEHLPFRVCFMEKSL